MKNNTYNLNQVYSIIRDYYVDSFPHSLSFISSEALSFHLKKHGSTARVIKHETGYDFVNENPKVRSDDIFDNGYEDYVINLEGFLSDRRNTSSLINDINALASWLMDGLYIKNGIATDKMLEVKKLI
ncbi:hypothetical protein IM270_20350 [Enterobacter cloacae complex sp. I7]|uniref:hypothetical protein n=2 Tax=Enterobacteriaceae TaxID=543 RepID=UPI001866E17C|nr:MULTISPECIES: hypothetical protein [Enterobacter]MBE3540932.1 hypothetical protein [Enterobacter cloacae complex sp. I7]MDE7590149.1 hypothetical protein [Enterobacter bugandensis]